MIEPLDHPAIPLPVIALCAGLWVAMMVAAVIARPIWNNAPAPRAAVSHIEKPVLAAQSMPPASAFAERWGDLPTLFPPQVVVDYSDLMPVAIKTTKIVPVALVKEAKAEAPVRTVRKADYADDADTKNPKSLRDGICAKGKVWSTRHGHRYWNCRR